MTAGGIGWISARPLAGRAARMPVIRAEAGAGPERKGRRGEREGDQRTFVYAGFGRRLGPGGRGFLIWTGRPDAVNNDTPLSLRFAKGMQAQPYFSVVMATRNRPSAFRDAIRSVLAQSFLSLEIIVVNDGSDEEFRHEYESALISIDSIPVHSVNLVKRPNGHGQSFALNTGVAKAAGPYLCFLDDDDCWVDEHHLERAAAVIAGAAAPVDVYMADQAAFRRNELQPGPIWLDDLAQLFRRCGKEPGPGGAYTVTVEDLLKSRGFCHLNTMILRRTLYEDVGGMEESIRWECDHDLYLRVIDRATTMKYVPVTVSRHNIPEPSKKSSMTTALSETERRLFQLSVFRRAEYLSRHRLIRSYGRQHRAYTLKRISESLAAAGRHVDAASYAREAFVAGPTFKWAGYTAWRILRALVSRSAGPGMPPGIND